MAKLKFTSALRRFFPALTEMEIEGNSVREVIINIEKVHPGISHYLMEDDGSLRKHVNIFIQGNLIENRQALTDPVRPQDELLIFQALSGG